MTVPQSESSGFFIVRLRGIGKTCGADSNRVPAPTRKTPMIEGVRMARAGPASLFAPHPDVVLNALDSLGMRCDGRLLALNSYENRVYQVGLEGAEPGLVVAKFYRPARWSEA